MKKTQKKFFHRGLSLLLSLLMCASLAMPAYAADAAVDVQTDSTTTTTMTTTDADSADAAPQPVVVDDADAEQPVEEAADADAVDGDTVPADASSADSSADAPEDAPADEPADTAEPDADSYALMPLAEGEVCYFDTTERSGASLITGTGWGGNNLNLGTTHEKDDGSMAYCFAQGRANPKLTITDYPYMFIGYADSDAAAILDAGYPNTTTIGGVELTANQARQATQAALWVVSPYNRTTISLSSMKVTTLGKNNGGQEVLDAVYYLVNEVAPKGSNSLYAVYKPSENGAIDWSGAETGYQTMLLAINERPANGKIVVKKSSADSAMTSGNSCYTLGGAQYGIYDSSSCSTGSLVETITTNSNGYAESDSLAAGDYWVQEISPSTGYLLDSTVYSATVESDETTTVNVSETPANDPVGLTLTKISDSNTTNMPSLAGAQFTVKYYTGQYSSVSQLPSQATRTWVLETQKVGNYYLTRLQDSFKVSGDELFKTANGNAVLPLGTITVQETSAPAGYTLNGSYINDSYGSTLSDSNGVVLLNITQDDLGSTGYLRGGNYYTKKDVEIHGGVQVYKQDADTGLNQPYSGTTLADMTVDIISRNDLPIEVDGKTYNNGDVITTLITDANGHAATGSKYLPYGTYEIRETKAPVGYALPENNAQIIEITEDNQYVTVNFSDPIIRGDFELRKIDIDSQQSMADVLFEITNDATGETHQFRTDENGFFSSKSSYNAHSKDTNAGTVGAGLWFGEYVAADGSTQQIPVDDARGALPYGTYTITELPCDANKDYIMWSGKITISRNGFTVDLKDVENFQMRLSTTAKDEATNSHYASSVGESTIIDTVRYENLLKDTQYTMVGVLMNKATQQPVRDADGNLVSASKTFTTKTRNGQVEMELTFDASALAGSDVVVFEYLYLGDTGDTSGNGAAVSHADINDEDQTIHLPSIGTTAQDKDTGDHISNAGKITIVDTVSYTNLQPGKNYTMTGTLMDKATGKAALDVSGKEITATTTFKAAEANGTVDITFTFDSSNLAGETLVAFETLQYRGNDWAVHADINDEDQSVHIPAVRTMGTADTTGDHIVIAAEGVTLTDRVSLTNLVVGKEYTLTAELIGSSSGDTLATVDQTFTATAADMTIPVTVTLDASKLAGTDVVFFETLKYNNVVVGEHRDLDDADQTIHIPEVYTTAIDKESGTHNAMADKDVTIVDSVYYNNLIPGKTYTVTGKLMDKSTGKELLDAEGNAITASTTFTAAESKDTVEITFTFDGSLLAGDSVVAFERIAYNGIDVGIHEDLTDEDQTIHFVKVSTTAVEKENGEHITKATDKVTLTDAVSLENLVVGQEYTLKATLMGVNSEETLSTAEKTFTATSANMTVDMEITLDASALAGQSVVFFERLYANEVEIGFHADLEDEGQTVHFPEVKTNAIDKESGAHSSIADEDVTIVDTVTYTNLIPGQEYTVSGVLMDKATGEKLLDAQGNVVTSTVTFTPDEADGSIDLTFHFDASLLAGQTVVVFESLTYKGVEVGVHADLNDENQTVSFPGIQTTAIDSATKSHKATVSNAVTIVDTVQYVNLTPGQLYTLVGTLMDKATGEMLLDAEGNPITASMTFIPETASGNVEMSFTFDASALGGHTVVVFERVYQGTDTTAQPIATHEDINSADQSVELVTPPAAPKTGDYAVPMLAIGIALAAGIVLAVLFAKQRKQKYKEIK